MSQNTMSGSPVLLAHTEKLLAQELGTLYPYLIDPTVQEVMINSPDSIWLERSGQYERLDLQFSGEKLRSIIVMLSNVNDKGNHTSPLMDCRLPGLRIASTLPPVATAGPSMSIRRHSSRNFTLDDYVTAGSFDARVPVSLGRSTTRPTDAEVAAGGEGLARFLDWMVKNRYNFAVSGSTSSGKTALLNALLARIPMTERVVSIEDTAEFRASLPNWVSFEASAAHGVHIRDLVRHTLRYRPGRIMVGEVRGAEAFDVLDAYNTGHPGSGVSWHSDTADLALYRFENMVRMAPEAANWPLDDLRRQIASTFRFVVHASNMAGKRGPTEVIELLGVRPGGYDTRSLFKKVFVNADDEGAG